MPSGEKINALDAVTNVFITLVILLRPLAVAIATVSSVIADLTATKAVFNVLNELTTCVTAN